MNAKAKIRNRPLGVLSDFVVETMPLLLASDRAEFVRQAHRVVASISAGSEFGIGDTRSLASLDAKMLEVALGHCEADIPALSELVNSLSSTSALLYEEIVLGNLECDPRTFTTGDVKESEMAFYAAHHQIELLLKEVIVTVKAAFAGEAQCDRGWLEEKLKGVFDLTGQTVRVNKEHFAQFRCYLGEHPVRHKKGPSGLFSHGMAALEILCRGRQLPEQRFMFLQENREYYGTSWSVIEKALSFVSDESVSPEASQVQDDLVVFFNKWRRAHHRAVDRHVPDAEAGGLGTAGMPAREFLQARMEGRA